MLLINYDSLLLWRCYASSQLQQPVSGLFGAAASVFSHPRLLRAHMKEPLYFSESCAFVEKVTSIDPIAEVEVENQ